MAAIAPRAGSHPVKHARRKDTVEQQLAPLRPAHPPHVVSGSSSCASGTLVGVGRSGETGEPVKTLTASARRRITADWLEQFPGLGEYKPLHLLRRVGPLLEGIVLERTSGNDVYRPTFHVHSLLREFPVVTMALAHRLQSDRSGGPDAVPVVHHESKYVEAARRLARQCPLALSGELRLSDVLEAYRRFAGRPGTHFDANHLYEDMATLCGWFGDSKKASQIIAEGFSRLGQWPPDILGQIGGREAWRDKITAVVADQSRLLNLVVVQVRSFGAEAVPVSDMVFG